MKLAKSSIKRAGVLLATLASAVSLQAVNVNFDFNGNAGDGAPLNTKTFNSMPAGISVDVTGWGYNSSNNTFSQGSVGQYGGGLGVKSYQGDAHTVDNSGIRDDYLLFRFSQSVTVNSVTIGYEEGDSDFTYWIGNTQNSVLTTVGGVNVDGGSNPATYNINGSNLSGTFLAIAAWPASTANNDSFKVKGLNVDFTRNVPDSGSTAMLLGAGLVGLAAIRRKFRAI